MKLIKKYGVVLCAGAAFVTSNASAETSFYGLVDVFVGSTQAEGSDDRTLVTNSSGMTTSFLGAKTSMELSEGLTGMIAVESFFRPDVGDKGRSDTDKFFARNAYIGLQGSMGTVKLGRNTTPYFISVIKSNPFGGSFGFGPSINNSFKGGLQGDSGWGNSIHYSTPGSMGNFSASVLYSAGEVAGENGASKMGVSAFYSEGKFFGTLAYQSVDTIADNAGASLDDNQSAMLLGVSYDFGSAKVFGQFHTMETEAGGATTEYDTIQLGVSIPAGEDGKILISAVNTDISAAADSDRKTFAIGYNKNLTKKVDLYAVLYSDDKSAIDDKASTMAFGGRFRF